MTSPFLHLNSKKQAGMMRYSSKNNNMRLISMATNVNFFQELIYLTLMLRIFMFMFSKK